MKKINCLGEICPIPVIMLQREKENIKKGVEIMIITDHSCALKSITDYVENNNLLVFVDEVIIGVWEIRVTSK